jgi:four helix bundle protein
VLGIRDEADSRKAKEYLQFLSIARGSVEEVKYHPNTQHRTPKT